MGRSQSTGMPARFGGALVLAVVLALGGVASAAEGADATDGTRDLMAEIKTHEKLMAQHCRDKAYGELPKAIEKAFAIYESAEGHADEKKAQKKLVKLVGNICRKVKKDGVRTSALKTLGQMRHQDCARFVKGYLKVPRGSKLPPMILPAIETAGVLGHDSLVQPLIKIVNDSKNLNAAARAVTALGQFGDASFSRRKMILTELSGTLMKDMPGRPSRGKQNQQTGDYIPGKSGTAGGARYSTLAPLIPKALNELTGQEFHSLMEWMEMVKEHKRDLKVLFVEDEEEKKEKTA